MPITAMHENNRPKPRENQIGRSGQILAMQPEPETETVQLAAQGELGLGIHSSNARHHS
ncbi:hypothetical protein SDC9_49691 [bioreactor metagenome]|uniref:Uncharacterized protein n=1 Tax=bioreactor metagenome TaxID=1076179 RepID=A0A644WMG7_9ZZZZ